MIGYNVSYRKKYGFALPLNLRLMPPKLWLIQVRKVA